MAQVIVEEPVALSKLWLTWRRTIVAGLIAGILFWVIATLLQNYVVVPLACRDIASASVCMTPAHTAGNLATIIIAIAATFALIKLNAARPIVIALASAAVLWNAFAWVDGLFWLEALAWSAVLYAVTYSLFSWIARYATAWLAVLLSVAIVLLIRIAVIL